MLICYVYNLIDLHLNKSLILLYCTPDMKRQQIMGGCCPPWEAREQIKRPVTQGTKAMFWCCVIKQRHRAGGRRSYKIYLSICTYTVYNILSGFYFWISPCLFDLSIVTKLFLHFYCSLTLTLSPSLWTVLSLAHGSCLSKAMAWAPGEKKREKGKMRVGLIWSLIPPSSYSVGEKL